MTCAQAVVDLAARGCDLVIVSDANSFFIEAILQHHGLLEHFKEVGVSPPAILTINAPHMHKFMPSRVLLACL